MGKYTDLAMMLTTGDRRKDYDRPLPNFLRIALIENVLDAGRRMPGDYITPLDVDLDNIAQKLSRQVYSHKDDNIVDIIGYADLISDIDEHMVELGYNSGIESLKTMDVGEMFRLLLVSGANGAIYSNHFKEKDFDRQGTTGATGQPGYYAETAEDLRTNSWPYVPCSEGRDSQASDSSEG